MTTFLVHRKIAALVAVAATALAATGSAGALGATATPACTTAGLEVWLGVGLGGGAAGSTYYPLEFTNVSGHACHLYGFPGVSAVAGGVRVGTPARWDHVGPEGTVTLGPGASAHAVLRIVAAGNFSPAACGVVRAAALRVYPPNQTASTEIPFSYAACRKRGPVFLTVTPVQARVGVPGHP